MTGDRPRRSTRNSSSLINSGGGGSASASSSQSSTTTLTPNPYKKPTYLANRAPSTPDPSSPSTPSRGRGRGRGRKGAASRSAATSGRGRSTKPECVATRVESRRSTGNSTGGSGKKKRRGYNSQDYHYGSDFEESDQIDSEPEPEPASDSDAGSLDATGQLDDAVDSDSDFSVVSSSKVLSLPSPPVPVWLDAENVVEELDLPKSSDDLLLQRELVLKAVSIYEPLRRFHQLVRLSPFRFEDFCAALGSDEQSSLLAEIHIQLLKTILREEEANGNAFGPNDVKDSVQSVLYFVDNLTWPESLRSFIESDPTWGDIHNEMTSVEYPFCGPEVRIKVLMFLVDMFLATNSVREVLLSEGNILHEDHCRSCNRLGELICCETCPAVYHLGCIEPAIKEDEDPPDDWKCPVCIKHRLPGIVDCASELEKAGLLIRHEKLGYDRHGRKYWFLVRRILVESEDGSEVWYYTTPLQVEELLYRLDEDSYEIDLVDNIRTFKDEIVRQMEITEKITVGNNHHRKTYIDAENIFLRKIHQDREEAQQKEIEEKVRIENEAREAKRIEEEKKSREEEEVKQKEEAERKRIREERLNRRNRNKFVDYDGPSSEEQNHVDELDTDETQEEEVKIDIDNKNPSEVTLKGDSVEVEGTPTKMSKESTQESLEGEIKSEIKEEVVEGDKEESAVSEKTPEGEEVKVKTESRRKSKALLLDWDTDERMTRLKATGLYKLGQEGAFRSYVNLYSGDQLALSKGQHTEDRDRKRHMSHKFSLTTASDFKWTGTQHGFRSSLVGAMRATLLHMETAFPTTLMHVNWPMLRKAWVSAVSACVNSRDFSKAMVALAACIRPACYNPVWSESLGHYKLMRITATDKEERKKAEKRDKKDRDDEEDRSRLNPQFVKYTIPLKHQVHKQKGEEYRIHGRWGWIWLSTLRKCTPQDSRKVGLSGGPHKHVIQVKNEQGKIKTMTILPPVFDKLMAKRSKALTKPSSSASAIAASAATAEIVQRSSQSSEEADVSIVEKKTDEATSSDEIAMDTSSTEHSEAPAGEKGEMAEVKTEHDVDKSESGDTVATPVDKSQPSDTVEVSVDKAEPSDKVDESVKVSEEITDTPSDTTESSEDKLKKCDSDSVICLNSEEEKAVEEIKIEESETLTSLTSTEDVKQEIKEEKDVENSRPKVTDDLTRNSVSRKFKTDLMNVSLGLTSANRILYPKIAKPVPFLDELLDRRVKLQKQEVEEFLGTYGEETLVKVSTWSSQDKAEDEEEVEVKEVLDVNFPLAEIYHYQCYSFSCQSAADEFNKGKGKNRVREYECRCYSPMCRLKYFVQETQRRKEEKLKQLEKQKMDKLVEEIKAKRMYTKAESAEKVILKRLPEQMKKKRNQVKYPPTSTFRSAVSKQASILILAQHELRKLGRTSGRVFTPSGYAAVPKAGSWAWPYPCGRPFFKTGWQFRAVHAASLAAAAMQLRILWASVRWDDIQMKMPVDGRHQVTTDMEIITAEILDQRIIGRFMERVQYLRKKTVVPIDAPKTMRVKNRDSTEITPSRSGLRKRKRAESPDKTDPVVSEEWVDEDKVELWEIKYHGDKTIVKPIDSESATRATRTKSGVTLNRPDKYDPSPITSDKPDKVSPTKTAELMREQLETELKMQRAVHLSKRDNHPKTNSQNKAPAPTASQQLQQQNAAAGLPANPRSYSAGTTPTGQKKIFVTKTIVANPAAGETTPGAVVGNPVILNRKAAATGAKTPASNVSQTTNAVTTVTAPLTPAQQAQLSHTQKITVFRSVDGKLQVRGLLPGQSVYQTSDGRICLTGTPTRASLPQQQQQSQTIVIQGHPGQLQQSATPGVIHVQGNPGQQIVMNASPATVQVTQGQMSQVVNQPLINISNPAMRTAITSSPNATNLMKSPVINIQQAQQQQGQPTQLVHTYTPKNSRKANLKHIASASPATPTAISSAGVTGTINAQGQLVLTSAKGTHHVLQSSPIAQINQQGQIVITSQPSMTMQSAANFVAQAQQQQQQLAIATSSANSMAEMQQQQQLVTTSVQVQQQPQLIQAGGSVQIPNMHGGRVVFQDGNKTIVLSAGSGNITAQQIQQILQMQTNKKAQAAKQPTSGTVILQQQPQQQQQTTTMQLIQQPGQPMQLISGGIQGQTLQSLGNLGQPGQQIVIQGPDGNHQIATISGQPVLVKKVMKTPTKTGGNVVQIGASNQVQLQQLLSQGKGIIRIDQQQKPGTQAVAMSQIQPQQQQQKIQPMVGATTVTKTPGLPISIVSPSKAKMGPSTIMQQSHSSQGVSVITSQVPTNSSLTPRQLAPTRVIQAVTTQQQQPPRATYTAAVRPPVGSIPIGTIPTTTTQGVSHTQVVSAISSPQMVTGVNNGGKLLQHQHIRIQGPSVITQQGLVQQTKLAESPNTTMVSQPQLQSPLQQPPQEQLPSTPVPTTSTPTSNTQATAGTPGEAQKPPVKATPSRIVAQIMQTPQGPKIILSGIKPGELTPVQWASLQAQLQKQIQSNQQVLKGASEGGVVMSPIKMVIQGSPLPATPTPSSAANQVEGQQSPMALPTPAPISTPVASPSIVETPKARGPSPPKIPRISSPERSVKIAQVGQQIIGVKSQPPPLVSSPIQSPTLPGINQPQSLPSHTAAAVPTVKSPPNSANIDAAIAAVASNVDGPVVIHSPSPKGSPVKKNVVSSTSPTSPGKGKSGVNKASTILKNILQKPEDEPAIFATKSMPETSTPKSSKRKNPPGGESKSKFPKTAKSSLLMPVDASSVPQPVEQEVVICTSEPPLPSTTNNVNLGLGSVIEGPRFVLSQDLMTQKAEEESPPEVVAAEASPEEPSVPVQRGSSPQKGSKEASSSPPTFLTPQSRPPQKSQLSSGPVGVKSGSSRRKSPVKSNKTEHQQQISTFNQKTTVAVVTSGLPSPTKGRNKSPNAASVKSIAQTLHRKKEELKNDICKKRGLLEKDINMDLQKVVQVKEKARSKSPAKKMDVQVTSKQEVMVITSPNSKGGQKRKSSEGKSGGDPKKGKAVKGAFNGPNKRGKPKESDHAAVSDEIDMNKLYCKCKTPYDESRFYIGCDSCSNWFHGECIGISERLSQKLSEYVCEQCKGEPDRKYCLCKELYDETQFYICCDTCQDWFHGRCVGIVQAEGESIDVYICPVCNPHTNLNIANLSDLKPDDFPILAKFLKQIQSYKSAWPFLEPVDPAEAPKYYQTIKEPMDLQTVQFRVEHRNYKNFAGFVADISKILDNCRNFNSPDSPFCKCADSVETFFSSKVGLIRNSLVVKMKSK